MQRCYKAMTSSTHIFIMLIMHILVTEAEIERNTASREISICNDTNFPSSDNFSDVQIIVIHVCSNTVHWNQEIKIHNKRNVKLIGHQTDRSILKCETTVGFEFVNIEAVSIENITIIGCGSVHKYTEPLAGEDIIFSSSVFIKNVSSISLSEMHIDKSQGTGVIILESDNFIKITDCIFENGHQLNDSVSGGNGLYIEIRCHLNNNILPCTNSSLTLFISSTIFRNNSANVSHWYENTILNLADGGGLNIHLKGDTRKNNITILNCTFEYNWASYWGGGLNIAISNSSKSNYILVSSSSFLHNRCKKGGGGVDVGYLYSSSNAYPAENVIVFEKSSFIKNSAKFGGGVVVYCTQSESFNNNITSNEITFDRCTWKENSAIMASAVYLYSQTLGSFNNAGYLPIPTLKNCSFHDNIIQDYKIKRKTKGGGCFMSTAYKVNFENRITFSNNSGSALYLESSVVSVKSGSNITFYGNRGYNGGAIALYESASIHIHDNIDFFFVNNLAEARGGAIYQQNLVFSPLKVCFIHHHYNSYLSDDRNITFTFHNNSVNSNDCYSGQSIFLYSIKSCNGTINLQNLTLMNHYYGVARFIFENSRRKEISTEGTRFVMKQSINSSQKLLIIPGKVTYLPVTVYDDFDEEVCTVYQAIVRDSKGSTVSIDPGYVQVFNNNYSILLYGNPGEEGNIILSISMNTDISISFLLLKCPPGYILDNRNACICSATIPNSTYLGILRCNDNTFRARLERGYWAGYDINSTQGLVSALCPKGYCCALKHKIDYELPGTYSVEKVERAVCLDNRNGFVCGQCTTNYTAYYHTEDFNCMPKHLCKWGWLVYLASEILPVSLFFIVVIVADIQFTSGYIQGFVLYIQIFDTLHINANDQVWLEKTTYSFLKVLKFVVKIFNLSFFQHNKFSFCLWESASSLDIIAFKYVTIVYSLSLVVITVAILNCKSVGIQKCLMKIRRSKKKVNVSIIHGLSGFLVMCYSTCTKTTLMILTPAVIRSKGLQYQRRVAFYNGDLPYLRGRHLLYAIPALMFLMTMILIPPLTLLVYPLCYRVLSYLGIEESRFSKLLCGIIPLEKFKPFFDSFQSSFKDKHRYFSGLYFLYRLSTLVSFTFFANLTNFYTLVQVQFTFMLLAHAFLQPYKKHWHNQLDVFIFGTLAVINSMTWFNFNRKSENKLVELVGMFQISIAYLPLLYIIIYAFKSLLLRLKHCCTPRRNTEIESSLSHTRDETSVNNRLLYPFYSS